MSTFSFDHLDPPTEAELALQEDPQWQAEKERDWRAASARQRARRAAQQEQEAS